MYIKRHMEQLLEQITGQYPVLLVTGPRQVGKTTMLEHLAQKEGRNFKSSIPAESRRTSRSR